MESLTKLTPKKNVLMTKTKIKEARITNPILRMDLVPEYRLKLSCSFILNELIYAFITKSFP